MQATSVHVDDYRTLGENACGQHTCNIKRPDSKLRTSDTNKNTHYNRIKYSYMTKRKQLQHVPDRWIQIFCSVYILQTFVRMPFTICLFVICEAPICRIMVFIDCNALWEESH